MKLRTIFYLFIFFLPGCRYVGWVHDVFYQSEIEYTYKSIRKDYLRSLRIYDQFTTLGLFDILWVSNDVRNLYNREASKYGYALQEITDTIDFYILAALPHAHDTLLTDEGSPWAVYLNIDGSMYRPNYFQVIELPYAYKVFFGKRNTHFKNAYFLTFCAKNSEGYPIITDSTKLISLCFHSTSRADECVVWEISSQGFVVPLCDNNPDVLAYDI